MQTTLKFIGKTDAQFLAHVNSLDLKGKETLFLEAKDTYYSGDSIMTDHQFDSLEEILAGLDSKVIDQVGGADADPRKLIHKHMSAMLSLHKIQVNDEDNFPLEDIKTFLGNNYPYEVSPKFDGCSWEARYEDGALKQVLSRGKNGKGADITHSMKHLLPNTISSKKRLEVRGEAVMPVDIFQKKYSDSANPRNLTAGIVGKGDARIHDCRAIAYSLKYHADDGRFFYVEDTMKNLEKMGFNTNNSVKLFVINNENDIRKAYDTFKEYRHTDAVFQLDGLVIKIGEKMRSSIGENNHHPKWALAVKFPAKTAVTTIEAFEWNIGYTGEFAPKGLLKPVDLDGSEVKRVSLYNKQSILKMGLFPGATVEIKKSGDIIPAIIKVIHRSPDESKWIKNGGWYPTVCTACGGPLVEDVTKDSGAIHIMCHNPDCGGKAVQKLANGLAALEIKGIGESGSESLVTCGVNNIFDFFDGSKMNEKFLLENAPGVFKKGRELEKIVACHKQLKDVDLDKAILALQFSGLGRTGSKAIANAIVAGQLNYDGLGLDSKVMEPFTDDNSRQMLIIKKFIGTLRKHGVTIVAPKPVDVNAIKYEMTGSPSGAGFKDKKELEKFLVPKGYVYSSISKGATVLLTDSLTKTGNKMETAKKKNLTIVLYTDLVESLK